MIHRLAVTTKCPTCGAPLDFAEGSNAIQCRFCRSHLLVTGRKQILSYYIAPKLDVHRAVAKALLAHKAKGQRGRVIAPQLYFVPYYRMTGHDLRWVEDLSPSRKERTRHRTGRGIGYPTAATSVGGFDDFPSLFQLAGNFLGTLFGTPEVSPSALPMAAPIEAMIPSPNDPTEGLPISQRSSRSRPPIRSGHPEATAAFRDRYIEKNFIGCRLPGYRVYSLGARASVLRLQLFQKETVQGLGKIVAPELAPSEGFARGMKPAATHPLLYRTVLGAVLSIIYFPFWVIRIRHDKKERLALLDAVAESVVQLEAPLSLYDSLDRASDHTPQVVGFRPLVCPNCGWDLPVRPDDLIFYCSSCHQAWQIEGSELHSVTFDIARVDGLSKEVQVSYLPFWVITVRTPTHPGKRFFLPAFHFRRLKILKDLAQRMTHRQPEYRSLNEPLPDFHGCFYDQDDAVKLAQITYIGSTPDYRTAIADIMDQRFTVLNRTLTWFPMKRVGASLVEPMTGYNLSSHLLR